MECPNCNKTYDDDFKFCPYCGKEKPKPKICPKCKLEPSVEFNFCPKCGIELIDKEVFLKQESEERERKRKEAEREKPKILIKNGKCYCNSYEFEKASEQYQEAMRLCDSLGEELQDSMLLVNCMNQVELINKALDYESFLKNDNKYIEINTFVGLLNKYPEEFPFFENLNNETKGMAIKRSDSLDVILAKMNPNTQEDEVTTGIIPLEDYEGVNIECFPSAEITELDGDDDVIDDFSYNDEDDDGFSYRITLVEYILNKYLEEFSFFENLNKDKISDDKIRSIVKIIDEMEPRYDNDNFWNRITLLKHLQEYEKALSWYDYAFETSPITNPTLQCEIWYSKGKFLEEIGRYKEAIHIYDYLIKRFDRKHFLIDRANCLRKLGRTEEANTCEFKYNYYYSIRKRPEFLYEGNKKMKICPICDKKQPAETRECAYCYYSFYKIKL